MLGREQMLIQFDCRQCSGAAKQERGAINRAKKKGLNLYCGRECSGLARRTNKTPEQKKEEKSTYDAQRRVDLIGELRAKKREYHVRTYDPVKAAQIRKVNMPRHVAYCRRPEYVAKRRIYDRHHRADKTYGPFADAFLTLMDLEREIETRANNYELLKMKDTVNKTQKRKREYAQATGDEYAAR